MTDRFGLVRNGCAATIAATTEAPPRRTSRRGKIPKRSQRLEPDTLPLCLREEASPFWIILLLIERDLEHPRIKPSALRLPPMSAFGGKADITVNRQSRLLLTQSGHALVLTGVSFRWQRRHRLCCIISGSPVYSDKNGSF